MSPCRCYMPMSMLHVYDSCCMSISMLHVHVNDACPFGRRMIMLVLHVHLCAACPCMCCMSISIRNIYVHAACPCPYCNNPAAFPLNVYAVCPLGMSCPCCISTSMHCVHGSYSISMYMMDVHVNAACPL